MTKDIDKLSKSEIKKLLKKIKKDKDKKKKKKKKHTTRATRKDNKVYGTGSESVKQKPSVPIMHAPQQKGLTTYGPTGASMEQRESNALRSQLNQSDNTVVTSANDLKKARTEAQLAGDQQRKETAKHKQWVKAQEDKEIIANARRKKQDEPAEQRTSAVDTNMKRPVVPHTDYFKPDDTIDVATTPGSDSFVDEKAGVEEVVEEEAPLEKPKRVGRPRKAKEPEVIEPEEVFKEVTHKKKKTKKKVTK